MNNGAGKIYTFYSYKGGVGRTMAVANVGFLAGQNGLRVLVMDWDLEAPGLAYYFRGMLGPQEAIDIGNAPGVLDFLWDWSRSFEQSNTEDDIEQLKQRFATGTVFNDCVRSLLPPTLLQNGARLDIIGAGAPKIQCDQPRPYEEALSHFAWPAFYEKQAGGYVIQHLREWAKRNYDIILIDSRTGLADVAGVCTMQLPDTVALCFVLNRQNIDGVARIAGAIRSNRKEEVTVRAIPMRVAQSASAEESDAFARAGSELKRIGGFSADQVKQDFDSLTVRAAENLSYYETLSLVTAPGQVARLDPLTSNYALLTENLLGTTIQVPELAPEILTQIRQRMQPRSATIDYLKSLETAEPSRVTNELERLLSNALDSEAESPGELGDDYLAALINAAFSIEIFDENITEVRGTALDLARTLNAQRKSAYFETILLSSFEAYIEQCGSLHPAEEEIDLLEEFDSYARASGTTASAFQRLKIKIQLAHKFLALDLLDMVNQAIDELQELCRSLAKDPDRLTPNQMEEVSIVYIETIYLLGVTRVRRKHYKEAEHSFKRGLNQFYGLAAATQVAQVSLGFRFNSSLALLPPDVINPEQASIYAVQAVSYNWGGGAAYFVELAQVVLSSAYAPTFAVDFVTEIFGSSHIRIENHYGRSVSSAIAFLQVVEQLCRVLVNAESERKQYLIQRMAQSSATVLKALSRRKILLRLSNQEPLATARERLSHTLEKSGVDLDNLVNLLGSEQSGRTHDRPQLRL